MTVNIPSAVGYPAINEISVSQYGDRVIYTAIRFFNEIHYKYADASIQSPWIKVAHQNISFSGPKNQITTFVDSNKLLIAWHNTSSNMVKFGRWDLINDNIDLAAYDVTAGTSPSLTISDGKLLLLYCFGGALLLKHSTDLGTTWTGSPVTVDAGNGAVFESDVSSLYASTEIVTVDTDTP